MILVKVDQYSTLKLEDAGQYGFKITEGFVGKEGEFVPRFCRREFKKGTGEKNVPVSVNLGDKASAVLALTTFLAALGGGNLQQEAPAAKKKEECPF